MVYVMVGEIGVVGVDFLECFKNDFLNNGGSVGHRGLFFSVFMVKL